jgi:hypothetical protein
MFGSNELAVLAYLYTLAPNLGAAKVLLVLNVTSV